MSHTSTAPNGTVFVHNSDLSGEVEINGSWLPGADLLWLVKRSQFWIWHEKISAVVMNMHHGDERPACITCDTLIDELMAVLEAK